MIARRSPLSACGAHRRDREGRAARRDRSARSRTGVVGRHRVPSESAAAVHRPHGLELLVHAEGCLLHLRVETPADDARCGQMLLGSLSLCIRRRSGGPKRRGGGCCGQLLVPLVGTLVVHCRRGFGG
jgi:hypothetical protein